MTRIFYVIVVHEHIVAVVQKSRSPKLSMPKLVHFVPWALHVMSKFIGPWIAGQKKHFLNICHQCTEGNHGTPAALCCHQQNLQNLGVS